MATFTMPVIDEFGITVPIYDTVHEEVRAAFREVYGQDIYIEPDSQDGQLIAILALALHDSFSTVLSVYNSFSPSTAQGVGLSRVVKINGIKRGSASFSHVDVAIVGQAGTVVSDGIVSDGSGNRFFLPEEVVIPVSGEILVNAIADVAGTITGGANSVTTIESPTRGWQSVTNPQAIVPGMPIETDAQLRARQAISTMIPSMTILEGMLGAVADIDDVTRYSVYENDTNGTDPNGVPAHSLAFVVEGGDTMEIARTIFTKKSPGVGTYGTTSQLIHDDYGIPHTVNFYRPTIVPITVEITLNARAGYLSNIETRLRQTVVDYINGIMKTPTDAVVAETLDPTDPDIDAGFTIGDDVELSRLYTPANLYNMTSLGTRTYKITQIRIKKGADPLGTADIPIAFNEVATAIMADVTVAVV